MGTNSLKGSYKTKKLQTKKAETKQVGKILEKILRCHLKCMCKLKSETRKKNVQLYGEV